MLMVVDGLFPLGMNMRMRVLVGMSVLLLVGVDRPIGMPMRVAVTVRVNVLVGMLMRELCGHGSASSLLEYTFVA